MVNAKELREAIHKDMTELVQKYSVESGCKIVTDLTVTIYPPAPKCSRCGGEICIVDLVSQYKPAIKRREMVLVQGYCANTHCSLANVAVFVPNPKLAEDEDGDV